MKKILLILFLLFSLNLTGLAQDNWFSPTGHSSDYQWSYPFYTYDASDTTYASVTIPPSSWTSYLTLTFSSVSIDKVKILSGNGYGYVTSIKLDYYDGDTWVNFYEGEFTDDAWDAYNIGKTVDTDRIRIAYYNNYRYDEMHMSCYEVCINEVAGIPITFNGATISKWNETEISKWNGVE